jgi:hypothetical protein
MRSFRKRGATIPKGLKTKKKDFYFHIKLLEVSVSKKIVHKV